MAAPRTLNELIFDSMDRFRDRPVYQRVRVDGRWVDINYRDFFGRVEAFAAGLRTLGVEAGQHVAILSENRPEWSMADFACLIIRCVDVPIYPTLPAAQAAYILRDSGAVVVCCSTQAQWEKVRSIRSEVPSLRHVIVFDGAAVGTEAHSVEDIVRAGRAEGARNPRWREDALMVEPDDLATIIYTSGTTGDPKGVMLTHGNIASNVAASLQCLDVMDEDETISFLPLSHIFERMVGLYSMLARGVVTNFAESFDTVVRDIQERRPTVVAAVPRVYEKVYAKALDTAVSGGTLTRRLFLWAKRNGEAWATLTLAGKPIPGFLALKRALADRLVFARLRARLGGRVRYFLSGGAPLSPDIARFFYAAGMRIHEGYGLTETSPVISVNTATHYKLGTVGRPIPGVEVRIADDGEILCRGPNVMKGYYRKPEATAEAIDAEGWFHTGDIGLLDEDGFLKITDRKKDLIVTAGGKNIAPQPIENRLKTNPFISNAVMLGDRRRFPIVLLVPALDKVESWATAQGLSFGDLEALVALPEVKAKMEGEMKKQLRDLAHFEVPKKVVVLSRDFSIERGEMTPKMSVRRKVVEHHFREAIEALYATAPAGEHEMVDQP